MAWRGMARHYSIRLLLTPFLYIFLWSAHYNKFLACISSTHSTCMSCVGGCTCVVVWVLAIFFCDKRCVRELVILKDIGFQKDPVRHLFNKSRFSKNLIYNLFFRKPIYLYPLLVSYHLRFVGWVFFIFCTFPIQSVVLLWLITHPSLMGLLCKSHKKLLG